MQIASYMTNSKVRLACCSILVSSQRMGSYIVRPGLFGYDRRICEAFDACVLMLIQTYFESTCNLANVHLSAGAWHFVDNACLFHHKEGVFDLSEERTDGGPDSNTALMLKSLHTLLILSLTFNCCQYPINIVCNV